MHAPSRQPSACPARLAGAASARPRRARTQMCMVYVCLASRGWERQAVGVGCRQLRLRRPSACACAWEGRRHVLYWSWCMGAWVCRDSSLCTSVVFGKQSGWDGWMWSCMCGRDYVCAFFCEMRRGRRPQAPGPHPAEYGVRNADTLRTLFGCRSGFTRPAHHVCLPAL